MENQENIWIKSALEKALYLYKLDVPLMKIREEVLKIQKEQFWGNERRLLLELMLHELSNSRPWATDSEIPF